MRKSTQIVGLIGLAGLLAAPAGAAITPLDSTHFTYKTEMNDGGDLNATASTSDWTRNVSEVVSGEASANLSNGALTYSTSLNHAATNLSWKSTQYTSDVVKGSSATNGGTGETIEVSVQAITGYKENVAGHEQYAGFAFALVAGINQNTWITLDVATDGTYYDVGSGPVKIDSNDNTDAAHVFRLARGNGDWPDYYDWQIWRDGVQIGTNIRGRSSWSAGLNFGDNTSDWSGSAAVDYVRWTPGAYSPAPVPEPAGMAAVAIGGLLMIRRRK